MILDSISSSGLKTRFPAISAKKRKEEKFPTKEPSHVYKPSTLLTHAFIRQKSRLIESQSDDGMK